MKPKAAIDTGIVLQAALNETGPSGQTLDLLDAGKIEVYVSPRLRSEYEYILNRDDLRARFARLTPSVIEAALTRIDTRAILIHPVPSSVNFPRDPKDEPILNLAIHIQADFIVARDKDLLDLKDSVKGIRIVDPVTFLRLYEETHPSDERR